MWSDPFLPFYQPTAAPSLLGSEPAIKAPLSGSRAMT